MSELTKEQQQLVMDHLHLVRLHAEKVAAIAPRAGSVLFEELRGEGMQALVEVARTFEPSRGVKFTTYAWYRIRGSMLELVRKHLDDYRGATSFAGRAAAAHSAGEWRTAGDLAFEEDDVCAADLSAMVDGIASVYALGAIAEATRRFGETATIERLDWQRALDALRGCMEALPAQDRDVIRSRVLEEATVDEVAAKLGISSGTVKRRYTRGEGALRACLAAKALTHLPGGHARLHEGP